MNKDIGSRLKSDLQSLYGGNEFAQAFFDSAADRINDAVETSVERMSQIMATSYAEARGIAKALCDIGCGEFVVGRKGWKSRVRWAYSLRSMGKAAGGENVEIEEVDPVLIEEAGDQMDSVSSSDNSPSKGLTITEAKRRLADTFGISPEAIEITIKA